MGGGIVILNCWIKQRGWDVRQKGHIFADKCINTVHYTQIQMRNWEKKGSKAINWCQYPVSNNHFVQYFHLCLWVINRCTVRRLFLECLWKGPLWGLVIVFSPHSNETLTPSIVDTELPPKEPQPMDNTKKVQHRCLLTATRVLCWHHTFTLQYISLNVTYCKPQLCNINPEISLSCPNSYWMFPHCFSYKSN